MSTDSAREKNVRSTLYLALYVCIADEVLSELEEESIIKQIKNHFQGVEESFLLQELERFFDLELSLDQLLEPLKETEFLELSLKIAYEAADADGLDVRENIAFQRVLRMCGYHLEDIVDV